MSAAERASEVSSAEQQMSEPCERTSKRRSEWPATLRVNFIVILPTMQCSDAVKSLSEWAFTSVASTRASIQTSGRISARFWSYHRSNQMSKRGIGLGYWKSNEQNVLILTSKHATELSNDERISILLSIPTIAQSNEHRVWSNRAITWLRDQTSKVPYRANRLRSDLPGCREWSSAWDSWVDRWDQKSKAGKEICCARKSSVGLLAHPLG